MCKESLQFWKAARATVTKPLLPPCPADLSEPAYANLMFDTHCHVSEAYFSPSLCSVFIALLSIELLETELPGCVFDV